MAGLKSTVAFLGINATAFYAAPDAAPYVLGATAVLYLIYLTMIMVAGMLGTFFGRFEDEEDRAEFVGDLMEPGRKERRKEEKKKRKQGRWWDAL